MSDKKTELCATCSDQLIEDFDNDLCKKCQRNLMIALEGTMSNKKWTPEPWRYDIGKIFAGAIELGTFYFTFGEVKRTPHVENAERAVACVNACEGLNPEAVREALKAAFFANECIEVLHKQGDLETLPDGFVKLREALAKLKED